MRAEIHLGPKDARVLALRQIERLQQSIDEREALIMALNNARSLAASGGGHGIMAYKCTKDGVQSAGVIRVRCTVIPVLETVASASEPATPSTTITKR